MKTRSSLLILVVLIVLAVPGARADDSVELTPAAVEAVERLLPNASIIGIGQEHENGVLFYEVVVLEGDRKFEVEVTPDGAIGEVETMVDISDVPYAVRDQIQKLTKGAPVESVERSEVRGMTKNGRFIEVNPPVIVYEVEYEVDGESKEMAFRADGLPLEVDEDDHEGDDDDHDHGHDRKGHGHD